MLICVIKFRKLYLSQIQNFLIDFLFQFYNLNSNSQSYNSVQGKYLLNFKKKSFKK